MVNTLLLRELRVLRGDSSFLCELRASVVNNLLLRELRVLRGESLLLIGWNVWNDWNDWNSRNAIILC